MDLIQFEAGTKISDAKVTINGIDYPVTPARYTGNTPLSVYILNLMQSNIAKAVVPTGGTAGQVLVKKSNADNDVEWQTGGGGGASGDTFPIGAISEYAGATAPTNWLICDGSAISRTTYADLFNVIGTRYGTGDGSTTFNLPDLRGRVPVGLNSNDTDFNTLGNTGGEKTHTLTIQEMPSHRHSVAVTGNEGSSGWAMHGNWSDDGTTNTEYTGGGQPHNIMQPYIVQNYIIKAFQSSGVVANVVQAKSNSTTDVYSCDYINKAIQVNKETNKEVATNEYIDDKRVYVKRIDFGVLPNANSKTVSTGLNVNEVTICKPLMGYAYGIDINNIHYVMTLPDVAPNYPEGATRLTMSSSNSIYNIIITTGIDRSNYNGYVDIYYTKTTD